MIKIAVVSHLHPTVLKPYQGKFIRDQLLLLNNIDGVKADLIVPTPYSFKGSNKFKNNNSELIDEGYRSFRVFYLSIPRQIFPRITRRNISAKILSFLQQKNYSVIHINWLYPDGMIIPKLKNNSWKTILHLHGSDWHSNIGKRKMKSIIKKSLEDVDKVISVGPDINESVQTSFPNIKEKSEIVYNTIDKEKYFEPSTELKRQAKLDLGWSSKKKHALTVSNIRYEKGIDILLNAIVSNKNLSNTVFHIIGKSDDNEYVRKINYLKKNAPSGNVFIYEPVHPDQLIKYYHAADLYISPSRREGFGLALTEACFTGLPFISTPVGIAPVLHTLNFGEILTKNEFHNIPEKIFSITNMEKPRNMKNLHHLFSDQSYSKKILDIYKQLI